MIKLTRAVVERMVLLCLFMKERDFQAYQLFEEALGFRSKQFNQRDVLHEIYRGEGLTREESGWDYLLDQLVGQLKAAANGDAGVGHHPALIDTIVGILQGPYAKSVLAGRSLQQLRRAVLLPEEMGKVGESARKELHCTSCGKCFVNSEMLVFVGDDGESPGFLCTRCHTPSYVACRAAADCDSGSIIDQKLLTKAMGNKPDCGTHSAKPENLDKVPPGGIILENILNENPVAPRQVVFHANGWAEVGRDPAAPAQNQFRGIVEEANVLRAAEPPRFMRRPRAGRER